MFPPFFSFYKNKEKKTQLWVKKVVVSFCLLLCFKFIFVTNCVFFPWHCVIFYIGLYYSTLSYILFDIVLYFAIYCVVFQLYLCLLFIFVIVSLILALCLFVNFYFIYIYFWMGMMAETFQFLNFFVFYIYLNYDFFIIFLN